jgi:hypothetical protein
MFNFSHQSDCLFITEHFFYQQKSKPSDKNMLIFLLRLEFWYFLVYFISDGAAGQPEATLSRRQIDLAVWFVLTARRGKIILMWMLMETSASDVGTMFNPSPASELTPPVAYCCFGGGSRRGQGSCINNSNCLNSQVQIAWLIMPIYV